jgi:hypothetical protein
MKCTSLVVTALLVSSTAAFTTPPVAFRGTATYAASTTTTAVPTRASDDELPSTVATPVNLGRAPHQLSSALALAALTFMVAMPPAAVDAAVAPTPEMIVLTKATKASSSSSKAKPAAVSTVSPARNTLDVAQEAVASTTARVTALAAEIKSQNAAASKDKSVLTTALQEADRAGKAFGRENDFMNKMPPKTPVITLKAQRDKVGTYKGME